MKPVTPELLRGLADELEAGRAVLEGERWEPDSEGTVELGFVVRRGEGGQERHTVVIVGDVAPGRLEERK